MVNCWTDYSQIWCLGFLGCLDIKFYKLGYCDLLTGLMRSGEKSGKSGKFKLHFPDVEYEGILLFYIKISENQGISVVDISIFSISPKKFAAHMKDILQIDKIVEIYHLFERFHPGKSGNYQEKSRYGYCMNPVLSRHGGYDSHRYIIISKSLLALSYAIEAKLNKVGLSQWPIYVVDTYITVTLLYTDFI